MRKFYGMFSIVVMLLIVAMGISGPAAAQPKVSVVTTHTGMMGMLSRIVKDNKLDLKNGVNIDFKPLGAAQGQQIFVQGQVTIGQVNAIALGRVTLRGRKISMFSPVLWNHVSVLAQAGSGITSLEQLKGKKLTLLPRISGSYNIFSLISRMQGVNIETTYQLIFGSPPVMMGLFAKKEVDALFIWEPHVSRYLHAKRAVEVVRVRDIWEKATGLPFLFIGYAAYDEWLNANKQTARKVHAANQDGIKLFESNPLKAINTYRKYLKVKDDAHAALLAKRLRGVYAARWDEKVMENLELAISKAAEFGLLKGMPKRKMFVKLD